MKYIGILFLVLGALLMSLSLLWMLSGCCHRPEDCKDPHNPSCPNFEPCIDAVRANADFKIYEQLGGDWTDMDTVLYTETDTIIGDHTVFRMTHKRKGIDYDSVRWTIGTQAKTYTTDSVYFDSFGTFQGSLIVRLIVYKTPNKACNPNDDGIDTLIKPLWVIPIEKAAVWGKFRGHDEDNPSFNYTIELGLSYLINPTYQGIKYLPDSMIYPHEQWIDVLFDNQAVIINSDENNIAQFGVVSGFGHIQPDGKTLIIDYYVRDNPKYPNKTIRRFVGTRIP